jgi:hypothetical protein
MILQLTPLCTNCARQKQFLFGRSRIYLSARVLSRLRRGSMLVRGVGSCLSIGEKCSNQYSESVRFCTKNLWIARQSVQFYTALFHGPRRISGSRCGGRAPNPSIKLSTKRDQAPFKLH